MNDLELKKMENGGKTRELENWWVGLMNLKSKIKNMNPTNFQL